MISVFIDTSDLYFCFKKRFPNEKKLDYTKYLKFIRDNYSYINNVPQEIRVFAYGYDFDNRTKDFITMLEHIGCIVRFPRPPSNVGRAHLGTLIAIDVMSMKDKSILMVFGSSDPSLLPLIAEVREEGVQCVVYACGIPAELKVSADHCHEIMNKELTDVQPTDTTKSA